MPKKSRLENILFTLVMAFVMVYAMVCYNIAIDKGGMTNEVFLLAFHEIPIMWPIACILEYFVVEKLATMLAFRLVNPKEDKPVFVTLAICSMIAVWLQKFALNFPMALCWQIFFGGVFVRNLFTWVKKAIHHK